MEIEYALELERMKMGKIIQEDIQERQEVEDAPEKLQVTGQWEPGTFFLFRISN